MRFLLFIAWLFAEFWSIHLASQYIGGLAVFGLLILVAIIGSRLMQSQGFRTVANIQQAMQNNQLPAAAMLDALIVFIAGLLLVLPGFFSDAIALVLIFSGIRRRLARRAEAYMAKQYPDYEVVVIEGDFVSVVEQSPPRNDEVIEHRPSEGGADDSGDESRSKE